MDKRDELRKEFKENGGCESCQHYFNLDIDCITGEHNVCNEQNCYLCAGNSGYCYDYKKGDVPLGEIRGEDHLDREKRKAKRNLVTIFLCDSGADGVMIYVDTKFTAYLNESYNFYEAFTEIMKMLDFKKDEGVRVKEVDIDDKIDLDGLEFPDTMTEQMIDAIWNDNYTLFKYLLSNYKEENLDN